MRTERSSAEILLHPLRLRIVQAFLGGRTLTTAALHAELADVPAATLYRQIGVLAEAQVLQVAAERRVRGTVERTYCLRDGAGSLGAEEAASLSVAEHRQGFLAFAGTLLDDFDRYLRRGDADLARDMVGYRQTALYLSDAELLNLLDDLRDVLEPRLRLSAGPGRRRRILSTVLVPAVDGRRADA
jgi:hypothetical protein